MIFSPYQPAPPTGPRLPAPDPPEGPKAPRCHRGWRSVTIKWYSENNRHRGGGNSLLPAARGPPSVVLPTVLGFIQKCVDSGAKPQRAAGSPGTPEGPLLS